MYVYIHICEHRYLYVHKHTYMHVGMHACMHTYLYMHTCMHIHIYQYREQFPCVSRMLHFGLPLWPRNDAEEQSSRWSPAPLRVSACRVLIRPYLAGEPLGGCPCSKSPKAYYLDLYEFYTRSPEFWELLSHLKLSFSLVSLVWPRTLARGPNPVIARKRTRSQTRTRRPERSGRTAFSGAN